MVQAVALNAANPVLCSYDIFAQEPKNFQSNLHPSWGKETKIIKRQKIITYTFEFFFSEFST